MRRGSYSSLILSTTRTYVSHPASIGDLVGGMPVVAVPTQLHPLDVWINCLEVYPPFPDMEGVRRSPGRQSLRETRTRTSFCGLKGSTGRL
jgi:hypothetical protein